MAKAATKNTKVQSPPPSFGKGEPMHLLMRTPIERFVVKNLRTFGLAAYAVLGLATYGQMMASADKASAVCAEPDPHYSFNCYNPFTNFLAPIGGGVAWPAYWALHLSY